jgi:Kef-type K+ transport system membrane component KefB
VSFVLPGGSRYRAIRAEFPACRFRSVNDGDSRHKLKGETACRPARCRSKIKGTMFSGEPPIILLLGLLFLLGLGADLIGRHSFVPRVTLLILVGIAVGPGGFDLLPKELVDDWFPPLTVLALSLMGFLLGQKLSISELRAHGRLVLSVTAGETTAALLAVALGLMAIGVDPAAALLLGGFAAASDPASTYDVIQESRARGEFPDTLLSVVAIDDAMALLLFSLAMALATAIGSDHGTSVALVSGIRDIGGSILLGAAVGVPMSYLSGRIKPGEPTLAEAMGLVLLCGGLASWLDLSPVLSAMSMGSVVASLAKHHDRPFHAIEGVEWPFLMLFFIFAGASAHPGALLVVGGLTAVYVICRSAGTYAGAWLGARLVGAGDLTRRWMGVCLFPQAGVSLGMALLASQRFPQFESFLLPVALASTILFELAAPLISRRAIERVARKSAAT